MPADAVLYSPDTSLPRTGELALRRAIPANPNMKAIQVRLLLLLNRRVCFLQLPLLTGVTYLLHLPGIAGGHLLLAEDTAEEAVRYHGG